MPNAAEYTLKVNFPNMPDSSLSNGNLPRVYLYDNKRHLISKEMGGFNKSLDQGLYTIRVRWGGCSQIRKVHLDRDVDEEFFLETHSVIPPVNTDFQIGIASPALVGWDSSYEENKAQLTLSVKFDGVFLPAGEVAGLALYSMEDMRKYEPRVSPSPYMGYISFTFDVEPGYYLLKDHLNVMLVQLYEQYNTYAFSNGGYDSGAECFRINFRGMRQTLINKGQDALNLAGMDDLRFNEVARVMDLAFEELQSGVRILSRSHRNILLKEKFRDPLLGILVLAIYLRNGQIPNVVSQVISNLSHMMPESSDVQALRCMFHQYANGECQPPSFPPVIRFVYEEYARWRAKNENSVGSIGHDSRFIDELSALPIDAAGLFTGWAASDIDFDELMYKTDTVLMEY